MLEINWVDVINVIHSISAYLIVIAAALIVGIIVMIAVRKQSKGKKFMIRSQAGIAMALVVIVTVNAICFGPMATLISLAMGSGSITGESMEEAYAVNEELVSEGVTLLENNGALPLDDSSNVNVFGWASTASVYGGVGSGSLNDLYEITDFITGLTNAGFSVNQELVDFYKEYQAERPYMDSKEQDWTLPEPNMNLYTNEMLASAKEFSDTAVMMVSRSGGEGVDLPSDMNGIIEADGERMSDVSNYYSYYDDELNEGNDWDEGDQYLQLSNREEDLLGMLCDNFDKVVVVINTNNTIEPGFLKEYDVDAAIYAPCPGQNGFDAVAKVLSGEVNPSGRTVDTWLYDLMSTPASNNFGDFRYDNMDEFGYGAINSKISEDLSVPHFVNYVEGIYVGYKFWETADAEGLIDYEASVAYPFGYGLSYTTFTQEMSELQTDGDTIRFDVTVTNTGSAAGKDVVEVYYNSPYTNGGIEKATANLIAFDKTDVLQPGESQTLTIEFAAEDMASYDMSGEGGYVLESGEYVISINRNSHEVIDSDTYTVDEEIDYSSGRTSDQTPAENRFAFAEGDVTYLSRADGFANYEEATAAPASMSMSEEYKAAFVSNANYDPADDNDPDDEMPATGVDNGLMLADMRGVDYDDAQWDTFLDQMTTEDMDTLIALGGYQTAAVEPIGKVQTYDCDGPAAINNNFTQQGSIGFAGTVMMAATWNVDTVYKFGASIGKMADDMNVSGWYAPAMNIHRMAFGGRNYEYYSEDSVLSGRLAAYAVQGAETCGVYGYIKHFALNEQETNRLDMVATWADEQAIREIYLKPFEIAVKEGGAKAVMSSFNYIGTKWTGACSELLNEVLRDEWGFTGMVLTDYYFRMAYMDADRAIRNGNDFCLVNYDTETNHVTDTTSATGVLAMRQACKNVLYTVVNSRAYDPDNLDMGMQTWQKAAIGIDAVLALALIGLEFLAVRGYKKRKEA